MSTYSLSPLLMRIREIKILKAEIQQNSKAMKQKDCVHTFLTIQILEEEIHFFFGEARESKTRLILMAKSKNLVEIERT